MSFVGLDFGRAGNVYADLLRQAHQERIKQQQWEAQNRIQNQQAAALYDMPIDEEYYAPAPIDIPLQATPIQGQVVEEQFPISAMPVQMQEPAMIEPPMPMDRTPQGSREPAQKKPGLTGADVGQAAEALSPLRREQVQAQMQTKAIFDDIIQKTLTTAPKTSDGRIHPGTLRRIRELQDMQLKALTSDGRGLYDAAMLAALGNVSKGQAAPSGRGAAPRATEREKSIRRQIQDLMKARTNLPTALADPFRKRQYEQMYGAKGADLLTRAQESIDTQIANLEAALGESPRAASQPKAPPAGRDLVGDLAKKLLEKKKAKTEQEARALAEKMLKK